MPITIAADPKRVRMNTNPRIMVGGKVTLNSGQPAAGNEVTVRAGWMEDNPETGTSGPDGLWGVSFPAPPNILDGCWLVKAKCPVIGEAETLVVRIR